MRESFNEMNGYLFYELSICIHYVTVRLSVWLFRRLYDVRPIVLFVYLYVSVYFVCCKDANAVTVANVTQEEFCSGAFGLTDLKTMQRFQQNFFV